jgi:hypothetical protein
MRSLRIYYPNSSGVLEMRMTNNVPEQASDVQILLERITKLLQTRVGSNFFSPTAGCAIGAKNSFASSDAAQFEIILHDAVKKVETYIINEQLTDSQTLTADQKLESLEISNIFQDADPTGWLVEIIVHTLANQDFFITV